MRSPLMVMSFVCTCLSFPASPANAVNPACDPDPDPGSIIDVCGEMVLSGTGTGFIRIEVPPATRFNPRDITIQGDGVFPGVILTADPPYRQAPECGTTDDGRPVELCPATKGPYLRVLMPPSFPGSTATVAVHPPCHNGCELESGTYRLYLLTGGQSASASVRFGGVEGATRVTPTTLVHADARIAGPTSLPEGSPVYGDGFTGTLRSPGLTFGVSASWHDASGLSANGVCHYRGDPGNPRIAYLPTCPGEAEAIDTSAIAIAPVAFPGTGFYGVVDPHPAGTAAVGGYSVVVGVSNRFAFGGVILSFDES